MTKYSARMGVLAFAALVFAALVGFAGVPESQAKGGKGMHHHGHHHHGGGHRHFRHRRGGVSVVIGGGGYGSCSYLRHRARVTGSRYWWRRYHQCIGY